jgi:hypothetical protein
MDRSKRLAVLDSSENIRMVADYRAIVILCLSAFEPESGGFPEVGIQQ